VTTTMTRGTAMETIMATVMTTTAITKLKW